MANSSAPNKSAVPLTAEPNNVTAPSPTSSKTPAKPSTKPNPKVHAALNKFSAPKPSLAVQEIFLSIPSNNPLSFK